LAVNEELRQKVITSVCVVKPFGARGEPKISDAPVSSADIPKTIAAAQGLDADMPGVSIFNIDESADRERRFLHHDWNIGEQTALWPVYSSA
jgi:hypothetical protein